MRTQHVLILAAALVIGLAAFTVGQSTVTWEGVLPGIATELGGTYAINVAMTSSGGDLAVADLTLNGWENAPPVTIAATPYTIVSTSKASGYNNSYTSTGTASVMLPVTPSDGTLITITDTGDASSNNLTVGGGAATINGAATYVMNAKYESATYRYDETNTNWNITGAYLE